MALSPEQASRIAERFWMTLDLFEAGVQMMRQNLKRKHPGAPETEIDRLLVEWLEKRRGAEHGDGEGRPGKWPRQPR